MAVFRIERFTPLPAAESWRRVTDWEQHAVHVPLTRISVPTGPPTGIGTVFVARTGVGPLAFADPMEVTVWRPPHGGEPGLCRLEKRGRLVRGWAELEVRPAAGGTARVLWREELGVRFLPPLFDGVLHASARRVFGRAAHRLLTMP